MTPEEIAMRFASASAKCRNEKCPFMSECQGTRETCKLIEVAAIIRAQCLENEKMRSECESLRGAIRLIAKYCNELERINDAYYKIISRFMSGIKPTAKPKKRVPHIGSGRGRKKKSLIDMDGDERYAMPEEPKEPKPQEIVI